MKRVMKQFTRWVFQHISFSLMLSPIGVRNIRNTSVDRKGDITWVGYMDVFVFGIRIIRIQRTKPWV